MIIEGEAEEESHSRKNGDPEFNLNDIDNDSDQVDRIRVIKKGGNVGENQTDNLEKALISALKD